MILHHFGFTDETEVVFYDYSKPALAFKKIIITQWNGEDYPSFIKWALAKYQFSETGGGETERLSRDQLWQREIKFGVLKNY